MPQSAVAEKTSAEPAHGRKQEHDAAEPEREFGGHAGLSSGLLALPLSRPSAAQRSRLHPTLPHRSRLAPRPAPTPLRPSQSVGLLQRHCACGGSCAACQEKREPLLQRKAGMPLAQPSAVPPIVHDVLLSPGQAMNAATRAFMESRFGQDFGEVRLHTDAQAAQSAQAVAAHAYTVGSHMVFGAGQYQPESTQGRHLLAHELTHVVQQSGQGAVQRVSAISRPNDAAEWEAEAIADQILAGEPTTDVIGAASLSLQRSSQSTVQTMEEPITRTQEIALSQQSPGEVTASAHPPLISLYNFAIDSAALKDKHRRALIELGDIIRSLPSGKVRIIVRGHADASGEPNVNDLLSRNRASAVANALRPLAGRIPSHIQWAGEREPVGDDNIVEGRRRNRRVDLLFVPAPGAKLPQAKPDASGQSSPSSAPTDTPRPAEPPSPNHPPDPQNPPQTTTPPTNTDPPPVLPPPTPADSTFCDSHPILCDALGAAGVAALIAGGVLAAEKGAEILAGVAGEFLFCVANPLACVGIEDGTGEGGEDDKKKKKKKEDDNDESVRVTIAAIESETSPPGTKERIPPRVDTPVDVSVSGWRTTLPPISLFIQGGGSYNGNATIDGQTRLDLTENGTTSVDLMGTVQTETGGGPLLKLIADMAGAKLAESNWFAVSAIPENVSFVFDSPYDKGSWRGIKVQTSWESDSGEVSDLDKARFAEDVETTTQTGCFQGTPPSKFNPDYQRANQVPWGDTHGTNMAGLSGPGKSVSHQVHLFHDLRSNSKDIPMTSSGFEITREVEIVPDAPNCLRLITTKTGQSVTAHGFTSDAGTGSQSLTQQVCNLGGGGSNTGSGSGGTQSSQGGTGKLDPQQGSGNGKGGDSGGSDTGGTGTSPTQVIQPRPFNGTVGAPVRVTYGGAIPANFVMGHIYPLFVGFHSPSRNAALFGELRVRITGSTATHVEFETTNDVLVNIAPEEDPPILIRPHNHDRLSRSVLDRVGTTSD